MSAPDQPVIAICIATYKRPTLLLNCLNAIKKLVLPDQHRLFVVVTQYPDICLMVIQSVSVYTGSPHDN